jgi:hypothetical protein
LIVAEAHPNQRIGAKTFLQETHPESLNWSDGRLASFLEKSIQTKFSVVVHRKNIKVTMNGSAPAIGDLVIAIFLAIERQHKMGTVTLGHKLPAGV